MNYTLSQIMIFLPNLNISNNLQIASKNQHEINGNREVKNPSFFKKIFNFLFAN